MSASQGPVEKTYWIDTVSLVTLVDNIYRAAVEPTIGYADVDQPLGILINNLNFRHEVTKRDLESALWASNMLEEEAKFWHPKNLNFNKFVKELKLKGEVFNRDFNVIEREWK